jgi:hypothetical protein
LHLQRISQILTPVVERDAKEVGAELVKKPEVKTDPK